MRLYTILTPVFIAGLASWTGLRAERFRPRPASSHEVLLRVDQSPDSACSYPPFRRVDRIPWVDRSGTMLWGALAGVVTTAESRGVDRAEAIRIATKYLVKSRKLPVGYRVMRAAFSERDNCWHVRFDGHPASPGSGMIVLVDLEGNPRMGKKSK